MTRGGKRTQLCVACSAGGHLAEALAALQKVSVDTCFVTKNDAHVAERLSGHRVHYVVDPHTSVWGYMKNAVQSLYVLLCERPRIILSTGAGIALAACFFGKLFGAKVIFIENGARVTTPSKTGKLVYRIADVFYVQWKPLLKYYPRAIYAGRLL